MTRRLIGFVLILVSILILPYWIYIPVLFVGIVLFPFFWEGIILAFFINIIHNVGTSFSVSLISPLTLAVLVALIVLLPIRESLRAYV